MGGSSGGGILRPGRPADFEIQRLEDAEVARFQPELAKKLDELLAAYNDRDRKLVTDRLEPVVEALCDEHDGPFDRLFGGSVAKHTYVDGLSDIDCLIKLDDSELHGHAPKDALERIAAIAAGVSDAEVKVGRMAVTLKFDDGMEIQLLPALSHKGDRLRIPSTDGEDWSTIDPQAFRGALTKRNEECGGKLVPTIKLAKAVLANLDEVPGLSGYHVESLAIAAFKGYDGTRTTAAMLPAFFERARTLVLSPIKDSTGQSVHVDADLGEADSEARQQASFALGGIARRMRAASATGSTERWNEFFGLDE
jgi:hypothetical protein